MYLVTKDGKMEQKIGVPKCLNRSGKAPLSRFWLVGVNWGPKMDGVPKLVNLPHNVTFDLQYKKYFTVASGNLKIGDA